MCHFHPSIPPISLILLRIMVVYCTQQLYFTKKVQKMKSDYYSECTVWFSSKNWRFFIYGTSNFD
jgi:hypothetical protein